MNISDLHALAGGRPVIYLLDAANRFEETLLENWLHSERSAMSSKADACAVPILRYGDANRLDHVLTAPEESVIAPVRVVWQCVEADKPRFRDLLFGDRRRPGKYRAKRILRHNPERVSYIIGQPASIRELRERFRAGHGSYDAHAFAGFVERQASLVLDIAERQLQGCRYKVPSFVAENLQTCSKFNAALDQLSTDLGKSRLELLRDARRYMSEMIARPSTFWIDVMGVMNRFVCTQGYEADIVCEPEQIESARRMVRENPSVILWTHKSHVDGFAINSICFDHDFPAPHIMGGVNMAFAGFGFIGRRSAAIFIRRSFKDNPLYKLVLRHYIGYLMEKRFPLSWAFEGTRSRVGKLMPPRFGLLKYALDAARETDARNIHILPVAISYDLITDVEDHAAEQKGSQKRPESLRWFLGYLKRLRRPLGRVYLNFGEPVVLKQAPPPEDAMALSKVAFRVAVNANAATPITLPSIGCMVLLGATPRALSTDELRAEVTELIEWARRRGIRMTSDFDAENVHHLRTIINIMIDSGLVTRYAEGPQKVYGIAPDQQLQASYYRNTVIHYFLNKAIAELALAKAGEETGESAADVFWKEAERLRDLFKFEFFYSPLPQFREELKFELSEIRDQWESVLTEGGTAIDQMLAEMQPHVSHATLTHFVEAYAVVADLLASCPANKAFEEKDGVTRGIKYARQLNVQRRITSEASISELMFRNAYKWLENQGLTIAGDEALVNRRRSVAIELRDLLTRIHRIAALAVTLRNHKLKATDHYPMPVARASNQ